MREQFKDHLAQALNEHRQKMHGKVDAALIRRLRDLCFELNPEDKQRLLIDLKKLQEYTPENIQDIIVNYQQKRNQE